MRSLNVFTYSILFSAFSILNAEYIHTNSIDTSYHDGITIDFDDVKSGAVSNPAEVNIESASLEFREIGKNLGKALKDLGQFSDIKIVYYRKEGESDTKKIDSSYVADLVKNYKITDIGNENNAKKLMGMVRTNDSFASINLRYSNGIKAKVVLKRDSDQLSGVVIFPEMNGKKEISIFNLSR